MSLFFSLNVSPEIIRAACDGDAAAHEHIFLECRRPVYTLIRRLIPRPAVADDLLQDTFVELLRNIGSYSGQGSFGGWVRSIAVSKCLMYLRSPWHRSFLSLDAEDASALTETMSVHDSALDSRSDLLQALAELPALTRSVVWLHDVEGYTHTEIAQALGRTTSFSKSQLSRAHLRLRKSLDGHQLMDVPSSRTRGGTDASMKSLAQDDEVGAVQLAPVRD